MKHTAIITGFVLTILATPVLAQEAYLVRNPDTLRASVESVGSRASIDIPRGETAELYIGKEIIHLPEGFSGNLDQARKQQRQNNSLIRKIVTAFVEAADRLTNAASRAVGVKQAAVPQGVLITDIGLDVEGAQCYFDIPLRLWRNTSDKAQAYVLAGSSSAGRVSFAAGEVFAKWPEAVLLSNNSTFVSVKEGGNGGYKAFSLRQVNVESADQISVGLLYEKGCDLQATRLVDTLVQAGSPKP